MKERWGEKERERQILMTVNKERNER